MQNSPAPSHNTFPPSSSTPSSFMDTFDFGNSDFSVSASGLDDLNLFASHPSTSASHPNTNSESGSAPASHHPSPSTVSNQGGIPSASSDFLSSKNLASNSHANSPLGLSKNRFDNSSASPQASSSNPTGSDNGHSKSTTLAADMDYNNYSSSNHSQNLSHPHPQQNNQQQSPRPDGSVPQLSISDLQQMLLERERTERIQNMQTALLKQQLEQLSRMQQAHQQGAQSPVQQQQQQQQQQAHQQHQMQAQHSQQQHHSQHPQQSPMMNQQNLQNLSLNLPGQVGQLSQEQQQSFLLALQSAFAAGNNPNAHNNVIQAANQYQQHNGGQALSWQGQQQGGPQGQPGSGGDNSVLAQYGLMTPLNSGPFNNISCPPGQANFMSPLNMPTSSQPGSAGIEHRPGHDYLGNYTPLESPAVTPASVFSSTSTGIVMSELFSPLTSPALGPQPPSLGEMMLPAQMQQHLHQQQSQSQNPQQAALNGSPAFNAVPSGSTPTASPLALVGKTSTGSKIRKNRSTTAEARANKVRPSPLIKPVQGGGRKKKDSISTVSLASPNPSLSNGNGTASNPGSRRTSVTGDLANPLSGAQSRSHSRHQSMEAGQSEEGSTSTPSPIDLSGGGAMLPPAGPANKPLTPGSIMGIRPNTDQRQGMVPSPSRISTPLASALKGKARDDQHQPQQQQQQQQQAQQAMMQPQPSQVPIPQQALQPQHHPPIYANIAPFPTQPVSAPKVTFNIPAQMGMPNGNLPIQPGGLSQADRDAWMSYKSAGGLESRRTSHKAAEQKRRDSLKFCFDELRGLLPAITLDEDAPNGSLLGADGTEEDRAAERFEPSDVGDPEMARSANKAISKVALLRHSNEYLVRLKKRLERRDMALAVCRKEIQELREKLGLGPSEDPSVTGRGAPIGWIDEMMGDLSHEGGDGVEGDDSEDVKAEMDQTA